MERLKKITADAVLVIQVLIVFVLVFESRIVVPSALQAFGRLHPMLLHLPIGLLFITVVLFYARKYFEGPGVDLLTEVLLHATALTASLTTLMGLFLSLEGSFGAEQLWLHKWLGVVLSFLCWGLLILRRHSAVQRVGGSVAVVLLILTGHYGANLTHGEDFVWAPLQKEEPRPARVITDSTTVFAATIEPIFEAKCNGCHNPKKAKGNLVLTSAAAILKGGEGGALWSPEDAAHSLLVERLLLPLEHDDHMPPKDKAQLTQDEIAFIALWIDAGADLKKTLKELTPDDTLGKLASTIIPRYQQTPGLEKKYTFRFASVNKVAELNRPNRSVFQIAKTEPAIQADFFLRESYDPKLLEELLAVKEQLVSLNVSKMPVKDADLGIISGFTNLEVLNLNNTDITGKGLSQMSSMPKLRSLSLSGTQIDIEALKTLAKNQSLQEVYIWNTGISVTDVEALKKSFPNVTWNIGFIPDETEVLKLNPPMLANKSHVLDKNERLVLKHNLPGTQIRYSLDASDPDSVNGPVFSEGLEVGNYVTVKAKAYKDGWLSSDAAEFNLFRKGFKPDSVSLESSPDERYKGEGAATLFDGHKGPPNFYRHPAWLGFTGTDLVFRFSFEDGRPTVTGLTLSSARNNSLISLPPAEMQLWGGDDPEDLKLITKLVPQYVSRPGRGQIEGTYMEVPPSRFSHYKVVAKPMRKAPDGNPRDRDIWLLVDEIFIHGPDNQ